jgi:hypothetical protein
LHPETRRGRRFVNEVIVALLAEGVLVAGAALLKLWNWSTFEAKADRAWGPNSLSHHERGLSSVC